MLNDKLAEGNEIRYGKPICAIAFTLAVIIAVWLRFAQIGEPDRYGPEVVASEAHRALAREAAQKSMVLLKNDPLPARTGDRGPRRPLLPLDRTTVKRIALFGRLAVEANIGDHGSSRVRPPYVVTPLEGIRAAAGEGVEVAWDAGRDTVRAAALARQADLAVVVTGYTHADEGEYIAFLWSRKGGDRDILGLPDRHEALIQSVARANPCTLVVMMGGSAIITEAWEDLVPAILMAWYPGMEGGHALADLLFGAVNPSGKLPCTFARCESQLPPFDKDARRVEYGYFHGYRLLDREGETPAFPFGFGLSYTTFAYRDLVLDRQAIDRDGQLDVSVEVENTGSLTGEEVVQLYVGYPEARVERPVKELKGFAKVHLEPGERRRVAFALPARHLAYYEPERKAWGVEPAAYTVLIGPSSAEEDLLHGTFRVE